MKLNKEKFDLVRAERCLSKLDVARKGIISTQTLYRAYNGEEVDAMIIGKIARGLEVRPETLIQQH